jgi:hypothetical protein
MFSPCNCMVVQAYLIPTLLCIFPKWTHAEHLVIPVADRLKEGVDIR